MKRDRWIVWSFLGISVGSSSWIIWQTDFARLVTTLPQDDAFYYMGIARNVVQGLGFRWDGVHLTNGFQPLWQFLIMPIMLLHHNPEWQTRAVLFLGLLLYGISGLVLYKALCRHIQIVWALLALFLWLITPVLLNRAMTGMEYGIHSLLLVSTFAWFEQRQGNFTSYQLFFTGVLTAFVAFSRVEGVILFPIIGIYLFLWMTKQNSFKKSVYAMAIYTIGFSLFFLPYLLWNRLVFHSWMPISGQFKLFYEQTGHLGTTYPLFKLDSGGGQALLNIYLDRLRSINASILGQPLFEPNSLLEQLIRVKIPSIDLMAIPVFLFTGLGILHIRRLIICRNASLFWLFGVSHFFLVTTLLPNYSSAPWYHAPETLAVVLWLILGIDALDKWIQTKIIKTTSRQKVRQLGLVGVALYLLLSINYPYRQFWSGEDSAIAAQDPNLVAFYEGTLWMNEHLPTNTRIGAMSSGITGYFSKHTVINLDGLVNNADYLQSLQKGKFEAYIQEENIYYFADIFRLPHPTDRGISWPARSESDILPQNLRVLWRMKGATGWTYYILAYLP